MTPSNRKPLPQLAAGAPVFLTDSGLETELVFHDGMDLPQFAAFPLLFTSQGRKRLAKYYTAFIALADEKSLGLVLETPTWRASSNWGAALGLMQSDLDDANRAAIALLTEMATGRKAEQPTVISGNIGPAGDGYDPERLMSAAESAEYHGRQIAIFAQAGADMVSAFTMTHTAEAVGIVKAAKSRDIPAIISFTVETDGNLPTGQTLGDAIMETDAATDSAPAYYMINCAHPDHFAPGLRQGTSWMARIGGIRANASRQSHAELDACETLDDGDPREFGEQHAQLAARFPNIRVLGGCCGTDHRHVSEIASRLAA